MVSAHFQALSRRRALFGSARGLRALLLATAMLGLLYTPLCMFEILMGPNLHYRLYGFYQHDIVQTLRDGGFRPMVFMSHGLVLGRFRVLQGGPVGYRQRGLGRYVADRGPRSPGGEHKVAALPVHQVHQRGLNEGLLVRDEALFGAPRAGEGAPESFLQRGNSLVLVYPRGRPVADGHQADVKLARAHSSFPRSSAPPSMSLRTVRNSSR